MKPCNVCGSDRTNVVRESVVDRKTRRFSMTWYRCTACDDIGFEYRLLPAIEEERTVVHRAVEPAAEDVGMRIAPESALLS